MKPWAAWAYMDTDSLFVEFYNTEEEAGTACDYLAHLEVPGSFSPIAGGWTKTEDLLTEEFSNHIKELATC